jgi:hypothetical protein
VPVEALTAPMREFLLWVARCPRTYGETMEAWGSHCPRFTIWEDALAAGLVESDQMVVRLTSRGRAYLPD